MDDLRERMLEMVSNAESSEHPLSWLEDLYRYSKRDREQIPAATASMVSPSGMTLAGKYGIGVLSIGSMAAEGITALETQWGFAEDAAAEFGSTVDRSDWRVLLLSLIHI